MILLTYSRKKNLDIDSVPSVVKCLSEMKEFFQSDFNSKRRQSKIGDVTWAKTTVSDLFSLLFAHVKARHAVGSGGRYEYRGILHQASKAKPAREKQHCRCLCNVLHKGCKIPACQRESHQL